MEIRFVYMTVGGREEAQRIARLLVEERLVACVNLLPGVLSFFWWEGSVQNEEEVVLIAKTTGEKIEAVIQRVKELHSYDCPCVVALPIREGNPDFLDWVRTETSPR